MAWTTMRYRIFDADDRVIAKTSTRFDAATIAVIRYGRYVKYAFESSGNGRLVYRVQKGHDWLIAHAQMLENEERIRDTLNPYRAEYESRTV
jgi:hypothetical protein